MTGKTIRELALDAVDQALAESIRQQFISMALADPTADGGIPLALKRFKRNLPQIVALHKQARAIVADLLQRGNQRLIVGNTTLTFEFFRKKEDSAPRCWAFADP